MIVRRTALATQGSIPACRQDNREVPAVTDDRPLLTTRRCGETQNAPDAFLTQTLRGR
jgi:hypothetical protein